MKQGAYDDELLKFLFQLEPENFQGSPAVKSKFYELVKKDNKSKLYYERPRFCQHQVSCNAKILLTLSTNYDPDTSHYQLYLVT